MSEPGRAAWKRHANSRSAAMLLVSVVCGTAIFCLPSATNAQTESTVNQATLNKLLREALALTRAGTRESLEASLPKFTEALQIIRSGGDRSPEADVLFLMGSTAGQLNENRKALDYYSDALLIFRALGNSRKEAATLSSIGGIYYDQEDHQRALDYYLRALALIKPSGDPQAETSTLNNAGSAYSGLGQHQKALDCFAQARELAQANRDRKGEATALSNIGITYGLLGEHEKALDHLLLALPIRREVNDRKGEMVTLEAIGGRFNANGEKQKALNYFLDSLAIAEAIKDVRGESSTLNNLGGLYASIGEMTRALHYYERALPLKDRIGDRRGKAAALGNMGALYMKLGQDQKALSFFRDALALFGDIRARDGEAAMLNNIGSLYEARGQKREAFDSYSKALSLSQSVITRRTEAAALNNIAGIYADSGDAQKALESYEKALTLVRAVGDRRNEAAVISNIARLEAGRGNITGALPKINAAVDTFEAMRSGIDVQESQIAFFSTVHNHYEFLIDLLIRLHRQNPREGYDAIALQVSERARARGLLELLRDAQAGIQTGIDPSLRQREQSLHRLLNSKAERRTRLLSGEYTAEQATSAAMEIEKLAAEYQDLKALIRRTSPRYAALTQPQALGLKEIQNQLDADTVLLEYSLGNERSFLFFVSDAGMMTFELPPRSKIEAAAKAYYESLSVATDPRNPELLQQASQLSTILLGPVASQLSQKRLVIVADGALQYLPFTALTDPTVPASAGQPLILRHEIVSIPSMSVLATLRSEMLGRPRATMDIAVLADPVFSSDDSRIRMQPPVKPNENKTETVLALEARRTAQESGALRDGSHLERLPKTRLEADGIAALVPATRVLKALDFAANLELANRGDLTPYRYVTFATHGLLDSVHPEFSAIALSLVDENGNYKDGYLRAHEIYNLSLTADVVVLSACQTALGKDVRGEGLIGLTRGFMYAGVPRVVTSLWSARDDSTASLMVNFYREMIKESKRPAEALRAAQVRMLKAGPWQAPRYWAAFVLQGEWR